MKKVAKKAVKKAWETPIQFRPTEEDARMLGDLAQAFSTDNVSSIIRQAILEFYVAAFSTEYAARGLYVSLDAIMRKMEKTDKVSDEYRELHRSKVLIEDALETLTPKK